MTSTSITFIQHGIIFLKLNWSDAAQWAHPKLVTFLKQHNIPSEELQIFDTDEHSELYDLPELAGKIHGWGEAFVIRDGRIVHFARLGKDKHLIQMHLNELMRVYAA